MAFEYEKFDIINVAKKCGIQFYPYEGNSVEYKALCPFCGDNSYHLGLNRKSDIFNCFRCKEKGNSVSLYAKLHGISNKEAYMTIRNNSDNLFDDKVITFTPNTERPMKSLSERHNVYYDFLNLLRLNNFHRDNLRKRGLTDAFIHQFMYKSIPIDNVFRREILEKLSSRHDLEGIPGFCIDKTGTTQMFYKKCGGVFIPVCNHQGYIQGLQMRLDISTDSDMKKFRWFSSKHFENGTGAKPWIHVVGDTTAKEACLTEGPMKADVSSILSDGKLFIAVPGVNAIEYLPQTIKELHITKIYEAFDMDKRSSPAVKKALITLHNQLNEIGVEWKSCSWNPKYKGMDDYLYAKTMLNRKNTIAA